MYLSFFIATRFPQILFNARVCVDFWWHMVFKEWIVANQILQGVRPVIQLPEEGLLRMSD